MFAVFSFGADGRVLETSSVDRWLGWGGSVARHSARLK